MTKPLQGHLWHGSLPVTLHRGNLLHAQSRLKRPTPRVDGSLWHEGALQAGRARAPPSLPTVPVLLGQPPHPNRCQLKTGMSIPSGEGHFSRKSVTHKDFLGSAWRAGSLRSFSSSWFLKAQEHHTRTKQTDQDKNLEAHESLQSHALHPMTENDCRPHWPPHLSQ